MARNDQKGWRNKLKKGGLMSYLFFNHVAIALILIVGVANAQEFIVLPPVAVDIKIEGQITTLTVHPEVAVSSDSSGSV